LPKLQEKILGLLKVLYIDGGSAHTCDSVINWMDKGGMDNTIKPLRQHFTARRSENLR